MSLPRCIEGSHRPMMALLRADLRAAEIRSEALGGEYVGPSVFRGAATHCAAHLLQALDEHGWQLIPKFPEFPDDPDEPTPVGQEQKP